MQCKMGSTDRYVVLARLGGSSEGVWVFELWQDDVIYTDTQNTQWKTLEVTDDDGQMETGYKKWTGGTKYYNLGKFKKLELKIEP